MNDIVWTKSYEDYKTEVGTELSKASESFVRIGYLLKVARDTEVLNGTEFEGDYIRFAAKEFGLEKTQVSRFIRINDRFSEGGNSDVLKEEYRGYGTRKLGIMLTLPDELTEELSPDYTVEEMETIQQEVKEEQEITPIERYAEELEAEKNKEKAAELAKDDILGAALYQIMEDRPELFAELYECEIGKTREIIAPVEDTMYICRVPGVGKLMVICKEEKISIVNARTNEKSSYSYEDVNERLDELDNCRSYKTAKEAWEAIYNKPFPEEIEPKTDNFGSKMTENAQKTTENAQKKADKTKNEKKRVNVTKEKKNAEKERRQKTETEGHESAGNGAEERTEQSETMAAESDTAAEREVHDIQSEGSAGENRVPGEENLGGTEGEPLPSGTGETLSCENSGTAGGEGNADQSSERNKYSARLENLIYTAGILQKNLAAGQEDYDEAMKEAEMIRQCIDSIIGDIEKEPKPAWREIK